MTGDASSLSTEKNGRRFRHYKESRQAAISTVPDPSGSGRVDMLTSPGAAARAAVATGDTWKCGSLSFIFTHPPEDKKNKNEK